MEPSLQAPCLPTPSQQPQPRLQQVLRQLGQLALMINVEALAILDPPPVFPGMSARRLALLIRSVILPKQLFVYSAHGGLYEWGEASAEATAG
jgi:hypothetical protein